jgi:hypothetical protein
MRLHQPTSLTLYISTLELASSIRQHDSSIDTSYRQLTDVRRRLDSLTPPCCRSCDCCHLHQEHDSVLRLHKFLRCLHPMFEQLRAQLLVRSPLLTMVEAVTLAQVEEICLCGVLFSTATVLVASTASTTSTSTPATSSTPPSTPAGA